MSRFSVVLIALIVALSVGTATVDAGTYTTSIVTNKVVSGATSNNTDVERQEFGITRGIIVYNGRSGVCVPTEAIVEDGGYEGGHPNECWLVHSDNFDTPLCNKDVCNVVPHEKDGEWVLAMLGVVSADEEASASQVFEIPMGRADLYFQIYGDPEPDGAGWLRLSLCGDELYYVDETSDEIDRKYREVKINIDAYAGRTCELNIEAAGEASGRPAFYIIDAVEIQMCQMNFRVPWTSAYPGDTKSVRMCIRHERDTNAFVPLTLSLENIETGEEVHSFTTGPKLFEQGDRGCYVRDLDVPWEAPSGLYTLKGCVDEMGGAHCRQRLVEIKDPAARY